MQITFTTTNQTSGIGQGPPPPHGRPRPNLDTLARKLGVSTDDLGQARQSGQSLSGFATSKGISRDTLLNAVKTDLEANEPADAPELSDDQLTAMATSMVDRRPGSRPDHGGGSSSGGTPSLSGSFTVELPDSTVLAALRSSSSTRDDATDGFKQLLQHLASSLSSGTYSSQGQSDASSGSLGVNALA
jgi:hypothetical protein